MTNVTGDMVVGAVVARQGVAERRPSPHHLSMRDGEFTNRGTRRAACDACARRMGACSKNPDAPAPARRRRPLRCRAVDARACETVRANAASWARMFGALSLGATRARRRRSIPAPSRRKDATVEAARHEDWARRQLELYLYPDSPARVADGAKLDRAHLVNATAAQTIERERTLIESSNIIGVADELERSSARARLGCAHRRRAAADRRCAADGAGRSSATPPP